METTPAWTSWNRLVSHPVGIIHRPADLDALRETIAASPGIRAVGTGKSSADICAGTPELLDLSAWTGITAIDPERRLATVLPGTLLSEFIAGLAAEGWCLGALPDIDSISVAGAVATGTHGTGRQALSLSDYMEGCTLVTADGGLLEIPPGDGTQTERLDAARVSLGLLGVFASLSFRIEPLFQLAVEERPSRDAEWLENWPRWLEETDFLRLLWLPHTGRGFLIKGWRYEGDPPFAPQAAPGWHRHRRAVSAKLYGATLRAPALTPLANRLLATGFFSSTVRRLGSLYDTTVTKSRGNPLELAEWTVPFAAFNTCFAEFKRQLGRRGSGACAHIPMDVRFIRSSGAWLANSHGADTVTVGCVSRTPENAESWEVFRLIERIFLDHGGRPHWAKRFAAGAATLEKLYPRWYDFLALRRRLDPTGKFLNPWLAERFR